MAKMIAPLALLVCLAFMHTGEAFKCYNCDSNNNADCKELTNPDKIPLNECSSTSPNNENSCILLTTADKADSSKTRVKRYCMNYAKGANPCDHAASGIPNNMHVENCKACKEDGCNAAGSVVASTAAILAAISTLAIANFFARA